MGSGIPDNGPVGAYMTLALLVVVVFGSLGIWLLADCSTLGYLLPVTDMPGRCVELKRP